MENCLPPVRENVHYGSLGKARRMMPIAIFFGLVFAGWGFYYATYPHGRWGLNLVSANEWKENEHRAKRKQERRRRWAGIILVLIGVFGVIGGLMN